jgi:hypothetical protein
VRQSAIAAAVAGTSAPAPASEHAIEAVPANAGWNNSGVMAVLRYV